ncbi:flagellar basal body L-ring protein FlgH [Crenobacter sp. SG2305]|uniref:flagellar basal body L-ring protein FlgH n=1 Tax=Crenobacter oryzisoli TaxID=3056844 RepID=UPI0025AB2BDC|nr:flagellar basal body L-ring protein FlgH [Crenobacter sp. SG2305]MDN0082260.1 flagellar basal body L-ring protein FlgH [Crenobacter sp. SG2305]
MIRPTFFLSYVRLGRLVLLPLAAAVLSACAFQQPSIIQQPMTARPQPVPVQAQANGSIFQQANFRPLFQDRAPAMVGDTLTVLIQEQTSVSNSEQSTGSRTGSASASLPSVSLPFFPGYMEQKLANTSLNGTGALASTGKGSNSNSSSFTSSITVTVIEQLANGNLVVSGEKQIRVNGENEFVRLSGVVNPRDILPGNQISSTKVADARIEQQTEGNNRRYADPGWLTRIFQSVLPF